MHVPREKGPDLLNINNANLQDQAVLVMWSVKFSLSSITTPRFLAVFEGFIVDDVFYFVFLLEKWFSTFVTLEKAWYPTANNISRGIFNDKLLYSSYLISPPESGSTLQLAHLLEVEKLGCAAWD